MKEWSDLKKWWMDLLKSAVAFVTVSVITLLVLSHYDDARQRENFAWQADHSLKVAAIQEFSRASRLYGLWSYDAAQEHMCGLTRENGKVISKWEDEGYDNVKVSRLSVQRAFPSLDQSLWMAFEATRNNLRTTYNAVPQIRCKREHEENRVTTWDTYKSKQFGPALKAYDDASEAVISALFKGLGRRG